MFWGLDTYFLDQERLFRRLWDRVGEADTEIDFSTDTELFTDEVDSTWDVARLRTLRLFHGTITGTIVVVVLADQHLR